MKGLCTNRAAPSHCCIHHPQEIIKKTEKTKFHLRLDKNKIVTCTWIPERIPAGLLAIAAPAKQLWSAGLIYVAKLRDVEQMIQTGDDHGPAGENGDW